MRIWHKTRQVHPAGERMFVDYAGQTVDVVDPGTGEVRPAQIFVAVMGASSFVIRLCVRVFTQSG